MTTGKDTVAGSEPKFDKRTLHRSDSGSIATQIYELVLNRILDMDLKPFQELSEARLAAEFGVSRTPVREAFGRLARRNLVDIYPQRGTLISPISIQRVAKARFIRDSLERPLVRLAAEKLVEPIKTQLQREIVMQRTFAELGDDRNFMASDDLFHALIAKAAGFEAIWEDLGEAKFHMDRVRRLSLLSKDRMLVIADEHEAILQTLIAHDAKGAETRIEQHLESVFRDLDSIRREHPDYFADEMPAR